MAQTPFLYSTWPSLSSNTIKSLELPKEHQINTSTFFSDFRSIYYISLPRRSTFLWVHLANVVAYDLAAARLAPPPIHLTVGNNPLPISTKWSNTGPWKYFHYSCQYRSFVSSFLWNVIGNWKSNGIESSERKKDSYFKIVVVEERAYFYIKMHLISKQFLFDLKLSQPF